MTRFNAFIGNIKSSGTVSVDVKGNDILEYMASAPFAETGGEVDASDPLGLIQGDIVDIYPADYGYSHKDRGTLLSLTSDEAVITKRLSTGEEMRVHAPRWGYRVKKVEEDAAKI